MKKNMQSNFKNVFRKASFLLGAAVFVFALFSFVSVHNVFAANTCTAQASGNWSATSTWTSCGGTIPQSVDTVIIPSGYTVTVDINNAVAASVTLQNPGASSNALTVANNGILAVSGTLTLAGSSGAGNSTVTVNNTGTLLSVGTLSIVGGSSTGASIVTTQAGAITASAITFSGTAANAQLTTTGGATLNLNGTMSAGGTVSINSSTGLFTTGTSAINGAYTFGQATVTSGTLNIGAATTFAGNVSISGTWTESAVPISFGGNLSNSGTFTASTGVHTFTGTGATLSGTLSIPSVTVNGTYTNNGTLTTSTALAGTGTLTNGATGMLNIGFATVPTISTLTATATGNIVNYTAAAPNCVVTSYDTLNFTGSGAVTCAVTTAKNIGLSGTVSWTTNSNITLTSTLTVGTGTSLTVGTAALSLVAPTITVTSTGTLTNNGTVTVNTALGGTGTFTQGVLAVLNIGGTNTITTLTATANGNNVYYTAGGQTVLPTTYYYLNLNHTGLYTVTGVTTTGKFIITIGGNVYHVTNTSVATSLNIGASNVVVIVPSGTFTLHSPNAFLLADTASDISTCNPTNFYNSITVAPGTVTITPNTAATCFVTGGGGGQLNEGGSSSSTSGSATTTSSSTTTAATPVVGNTSSTTSKTTVVGNSSTTTPATTITVPVAPTVAVTAPVMVTGCTGTTGFSGTTGKSCAGATTSTSTITTPNSASMMMTVPTSVTSKSPKASIQVLQTALNQVLKLTLTVDGKWGAKTTAAVKKFQAWAKITADGKVGPMTSAKLNAAVSAQ